MKERIKELARQAQVGSAEFGNGINYFVSTEETFNRFADLIVKECAEVAGCNGHVSGFSLGDLIKQHFGVEE
jgi:hypothetical protein